MANICNNKFLIQTSNYRNLTIIRNFICDNFKVKYIEGLDFLEGKFESFWIFPIKEIIRLFTLLEKDDSLCIKILSYDLENDYVYFWNKQGTEKIKEDEFV